MRSAVAALLSLSAWLATAAAAQPLPAPTKPGPAAAQPGPVPATPPPPAKAAIVKGPAFLRFVATPAKEALQVAVASYHGKGGVRVDLVGAVHVGDAAYYRQVQRRLDGYDRLLYEMVKPEGVLPTDRGDSGLSVMQRWVKHALGLEFQLDAIDYGGLHFVHADIEPERLMQALSANAGGIAAVLLRWSLRDSFRLTYADGSPRSSLWSLTQVALSGDKNRALKRFLARELVEMNGALDELGGEGGPASILLAQRNAVAVTVLQRTLRTGVKRVGIFYGAAHLADLDARLTRDLGMTRGQVAWLTAWDLTRSTPQVR